MEENLALFAAEHASKLCAYCVDIRLEDHYNGLIIVADDKIQRGVINCRRGMAQEC
jgi:hypothetical protein